MILGYVYRVIFCALLGLSCIILSPTVLFSKENSVILYARTPLDFYAEEAYFYVDFDKENRTRRLKGLLVPPLGVDESEGEGVHEWLMGVELVIPASKQVVEYSVIITGKDGGYAFIPNILVDLKNRAPFEENTALLREHLLVQKEQIDDYQNQIAVQEGSIQRLKTDANVIARMEKADNLALDISSIQKEIEGVEKDIKKLREFLALAKQSPPPRNFVRREIQLTKQLKELAALAKQTEKGEDWRAGTAAVDLQRNLKIVEVTKYDDLEKLRATLAHVQKKRIELEKKLQLSTQDAPAYDEYRP